MDLNLGCEVMQIANVDELFMDLVGEDSNLSIIVYGQWGILCSLEFIFKYCNLHIISILVLIYDYRRSDTIRILITIIQTAEEVGSTEIQCDFQMWKSNRIFTSCH